MSLRTASRAAVLASAGFLMFAGAGPAAASLPSWRIVQVFGPPDFPNLQGLVTSGPANARVSGGDAFSLVVKRWDGSQWQPVTPPSGFANMTASSTVSWLGPRGRANNNPQVIIAMHWNGRSWHFDQPPRAHARERARMGPG